MQEYTDLAVGECLTAYHSENTISPSEKNSNAGFASVTAKLSNIGVATFLSLFKHPLDALFSWMIGVVTGVQDVIQTIDMANCKLPDFFMKVSLLANTRYHLHS